MNPHRLLQRQIRRHLGEDVAADAKWSALLESISAYYIEIDRERELIHNSLEVNSKELTELNERLRISNRESTKTMLNTLSEGVFATDVNGCVTFMNTSAEGIFGRSECEMIGRRAGDFSLHLRPGHGYHRADECPVYRSNRTGESSSGEEYFLHRDGSAVPVEFRCNPLQQEGKLLGCLVSFSDISERLKAEEKIHQLAFFDPLTGLPNRRLLLDRLGQAMAVGVRKRLYGAVLFIDVDRFKDINDTLGHELGDAMLQEMARRLKAELREEDTVARLGGDEFVVILEALEKDRDRAAKDAKRVGDKVLETLRQPYRLNGTECISSASAGIVLFRGRDESLDEILKRADLAMYAAKSAGRNLLCFFDPAMKSELEKRIRTELELSLGLSENQFRLYYQRRVDHRGRIRGAEALLRWIHPERGVVLPGEFIGLSEKTGQILPIGRWVLREACLRLKAWESASGTRNLVLSINVSAREFKHEDFVEHVLEILRDTGADPARLEMEITESVMLENVEEFIRKMRVLRETGITFALDDFGTGYSSLSYLKKLPLNKLKIDQSFIRDLGNDKSDEAIVRTILQIGKTLRLEVIAEGVESHSQRAALEQLGCRHFQGYLFGKPLPPEQFEAELQIPFGNDLGFNALVSEPQRHLKRAKTSRAG